MSEPIDLSGLEEGLSEEARAFDQLADVLAGKDEATKFYDDWKGLGVKLPALMLELIRYLNKNPLIREFYRGPFIVGSMEATGVGMTLGSRNHGLLYHPQVNHHMLVEHGTGISKIPSQSEQDEENRLGFYRLFPQASAKDPNAESRWPRLVLTSHHARSSDKKDITSITHGLEAMMKDCFKKEYKHEKLYDFKTVSFFDQLKRSVNGKHTEPHGIASVSSGAQPAQGDIPTQHLVMGFACDVEANPFLNGAALLRRINILFNPLKDKDYSETSQSAYRLAKTILQCLVTEPERINPDHKGFIANQKGFDLNTPLKLRPDARHVAQHISLIGYSKGGNVVSDAMRLVVDELSQKAEGKSLFQIAQKQRFDYSDTKDFPYVPIHGNSQKECDANIASIVRNIPLLSIAALEVPMAKRYKNAGVHRVSINNENDVISDHTELRKSSVQDEVILVKGTVDLLGHDPKQALGEKIYKKGGEEIKHGYILENEPARRRIEEFCSALYGAAAIGGLKFNVGEGANKGQLILEPAPGTPDRLMLEYCSKIQEKLSEHGFADVKVEPNDSKPREIEIKTSEPLFITTKPSTAEESEKIRANLDRLKAAMDDLRENEPKLVVNMGISEDIARHRATIRSLTWVGREESRSGGDPFDRTVNLFDAIPNR